MIIAEPASEAAAARARAKAREREPSAPSTRIRPAAFTRRGAATVPTTIAATRKPIARPATLPTPAAERAPPAASPETTDRMMRPMTSSSTAAPITIRPSWVSSWPRSLRTRAEIPMEVAVIAAAQTVAVTPGNAERPAHQQAADEGEDDPDDADRGRWRPHPAGSPEIGVEADLEEQDQDAKFGDGEDDQVAGVEQADQGGPEQDARQQFAEDGRLADRWARSPRMRDRIRTAARAARRMADRVLGGACWGSQNRERQHV